MRYHDKDKPRILNPEIWFNKIREKWAGQINCAGHQVVHLKMNINASFTAGIS
jgi:hypothetical protein